MNNGSKLSHQNSLPAKISTFFHINEIPILATKMMRLQAKEGVSPGIEPGTTRNIDLEFSRMTDANLPKRVSYR